MAQDATRTSAQYGKQLFNDPTLGGSKNKKTCESCHERGEDLKGVTEKRFRYLFGFKTRTLEEVINLCIRKPLRGRPLAVDSAEMRSLVAYFRTL